MRSIYWTEIVFIKWLKFTNFNIRIRYIKFHQSHTSLIYYTIITHHYVKTRRTYYFFLIFYGNVSLPHCSTYATTTPLKCCSGIFFKTPFSPTNTYLPTYYSAFNSFIKSTSMYWRCNSHNFDTYYNFTFIKCCKYDIYKFKNITSVIFLWKSKSKSNISIPSALSFFTLAPPVASS